MTVVTNENREKLPKHIMKDGVKWLMLPSKVIIDGLSEWPEKQNKITGCLHFLCIVSFIYLIIGQFAFIFDKETDLAAAADAIAGIVVAVETTGRRVLLIILSKRIARILNTIYFEFWPSDIAGKDLHDKLHRSSWILLISCTLYTSSAVLWAIQCLTLPIFRHKLPLSSKFSFPYKQSPYYEILYVWQGILSFELAVNICGLDFFFVSIIWNCVAQFRLLRTFLKVNLERIVGSQVYTVDVRKQDEAMKLLLVCFKRHNNLIRTCKEIEGMLTVFILMLYIGTVGTVCLSSFLLTVVKQEVGRPLTYFCGHMSQIFIYCYIGNELIRESTALSDTVFQCGWHRLPNDKDFRRALILVMIRSQRPITITVGGFGVLCISSYMKLLQFCFSVYTLLSKMMRKQQHQH